MKKFLVVALNNFGDSMSGGDTIWIELAKRWKADLLLNKSAENLFHNRQSQHIPYTIFNIIYETIKNLGGFVNKIRKAGYHEYVYSASDFYPDLLPALYHKIKYKSKWIAGYYLVAPNPFAKDSPYKGFNFIRGLLYWLSQRPSLYLVNKYADYVFVTSEPEKKHFKKKCIVIKGGVTMGNFNKIKWHTADYDCVFVGRLHFQKGILEMLRVWKMLIYKYDKDYRLAIIGHGVLKESMLQKIKDYRIDDFVDYHGFKNGADKKEVFDNSKIFLHLATYDSGGMAGAEAMANGLPVVGYNLQSFLTYYERGMKKCNTKTEVAKTIIKLVSDYQYWKRYAGDAYHYAKENWTWERRAKEINRHIH